MAKPTHIAVVLDRSGSMQHLTEETISGFNGWLKDARKSFADQDARLSLVLFDTEFEWIYDDTPLAQVRKLTPEVYFVRGYTALRDALGNSLQKLMVRANKGERCLAVVITDGLENASREISPAMLRSLLSKFEKRKGYEIVYMGANQDAMLASRDYGILRGSPISTRDSVAGTRAAYSSLRSGTQSMASGQMASNAMTQEAYDSALAVEEEKEDQK